MEENTIAVPAESAPAPVPEAPVPEAPVETEVPAEQSEEGKPESRAEKRIKQLVAKQREAEREADYWRGKASQAEVPQAQPAPQGQTPAPTADQFEAYDDFLVAKAKYEIKAEQTAQEWKAKVDAYESNFTSRINKAAENEPDILEIVNDRTLPISQTMAVAIKESEVAPDILKYLSRNREESRKIAMMNPIAATRAIGSIEYRLSNLPKPEPVKKISQAPEPIKPVESKGSQSVDLDKLPMDEYVKRRNSEQYGKRR